MRFFFLFLRLISQHYRELLLGIFEIDNNSAKASFNRSLGRNRDDGTERRLSMSVRDVDDERVRMGVETVRGSNTRIKADTDG